jgi:hypothetical protein
VLLIYKSQFIKCPVKLLCSLEILGCLYCS